MLDFVHKVKMPGIWILYFGILLFVPGARTATVHFSFYKSLVNEEVEKVVTCTASHSAMSEMVALVRVFLVQEPVTVGL